MLTAELVYCTNAEAIAVEPSRPPLNRTELVVLVIEDEPQLAPIIRPVCDYVGLRVTIIPSEADLATVIEALRPLIIMVACNGKRGGELVETIVRRDANLPTLLIGCGEAVEHLAQLQHFLWFRSAPDAGDVADFLFHVCRMRAEPALMPI